MKTALLVLFAALVVLIPFRVRAGQTSQRVPITPGSSEGFRLGDGGVPSGYMILGETNVPPPGYTFSGISLVPEGVLPDEPLWSYVPPMLVARGELAAAATNGKIYAIGGFSSGHLASVEEYSESTNSWSFRAPMPTPRSQLSAVVVDQKIYAIGGFDGGFLGTVEVYDPTQDSWSARAPMPTPRRLHTMVVVSGRILAIGGHNGAALTTVEEYDPATDTWATKPPMPGLNSEGAAASLNGIVYVIGGDNGFVTHNTIMAYDPVGQLWSSWPGPSLYDNAVAVLGNVIYSFGGVFGGTYEFNSQVTTWSSIPPMPTYRTTLAAAVLGEHIYLLGGFLGVSGSTPTPAVEKLTIGQRLYAHRRN